MIAIARLALAALAVALSGGAGIAAPRLPPGFVALRDVAPTIVEDIRYAGPNNFVGRPLPFYRAAACWLHRRAAEALARVQQEAEREGLTLVVFDCYRPVSAVAAMNDWAAQPAAPLARWHPTLRRERLVSLGYIARHSGHSTGFVVDLVLAPNNRPAPRVTAADCRSPEAIAADATLDFGTTFDCLAETAATARPGLTPNAHRNRLKLLRMMAVGGFRNYAREWWHFTLPGGGERYDLPVDR